MHHIVPLDKIEEVAHLLSKDVQLVKRSMRRKPDESTTRNILAKVIIIAVRFVKPLLRARIGGRPKVVQ